MVEGRVNDRIVLVNMENDAGLVYSLDTTDPYDDGDMYDYLHPNVSGNEKMARKWFEALAEHLGPTGLGSIQIIKATQPPGGTGFSFAGSLGSFTLSGGQNQSFNTLAAPRSYDVAEILPLGWSLQSVACTGGDSTQISGGVSIHLIPGQAVSCTFTNEALDEGASGTYLDDGSGPPVRFSFLGGSLTDLTFNDALDALVLDSSSTGSFVSQVFNGGGKVFWSGIEWIDNAGELPDDGMSDESVDLLGNVLLFHLNKDAAQGETGTVVHDFSGSGHTGAASGTGVSIGAAGSGKFSGGYVADATNDAGHIEVPASADFDFATTSGDGFAFFLWFNKSGFCDAPDDTNTPGGWAAASAARKIPTNSYSSFGRCRLKTRKPYPPQPPSTTASGTTAVGSTIRPQARSGCTWTARPWRPPPRPRPPSPLPTLFASAPTAAPAPAMNSWASWMKSRRSNAP